MLSYIFLLNYLSGVAQSPAEVFPVQAVKGDRILKGEDTNVGVARPGKHHLIASLVMGGDVTYLPLPHR